MNLPLINALPTKQRLHICICVLLAVILSVSGNADRYDDTDDVTNSDFKHLWDILRLSNDNVRMRQKLLEIPISSELQLGQTDDLTGEPSYTTKSRQKRLGVAGLDNLDMMTKILDKQRMRGSRLPMSVGGMSTSRLRMLMNQAGRRK